MDDFDALFDECSNSEKYREPSEPLNKYVNKVITNIEAEYTGVMTMHLERKKEKDDLNEKIKSAEKKLSAIKNPSNMARMTYAKREVLNKKLSANRTELRREITRYKVRLDEIEIEEGGNTAETNTNVENKPKTENKWDLNPYADF
jgi:chromosome segregation ATPase